MNIREEFNDKQIVSGLLINDPDIIEFFFYKKCSSMFGYIAKCIFDGHVDTDELVNELFIYLSNNNWYKLKQFAYKSSLTTWVGVVAIRFFQKRRTSLIEKDSSETLLSKASIEETVWINERRIDVERALRQLPNERYRKVIFELDLLDRDPKDVAKELKTKVSNLYNIRRRAHLQLKRFLN